MHDECSAKRVGYPTKRRCAGTVPVAAWVDDSPPRSSLEPPEDSCKQLSLSGPVLVLKPGGLAASSRLEETVVPVAV